MFNIVKQMFEDWTADPRCAACRGRGADCVCPEDIASSLPVDLGHKPTVSFRLYCELNPWAPECKIYED